MKAQKFVIMLMITPYLHLTKTLTMLSEKFLNFR